MTLTFRTSNSGRVSAAYLGACRVGYIECASRAAGFVWHTCLVRPEGGAAAGRVPTMEDAHREMECAVLAWVEAAGLVPFAPAKTKVAPKSKKKVASSIPKA